MPDETVALDQAPARDVRVEPVMGTVLSIDVRDPHPGPGAIDAALGWFHEVDRVFSTFRDDSDISQLRRGEIVRSQCSRDVREVLRLCEAVHRRSGGAFDAGQGVDLDPSALVKGWSVDRAARILEAAGAGNFSINAGGDVLTRGQPEPGRRWRIGIQHPEVRDEVAVVIEVGAGAVATSGGYERGAHIRDPRTGLAAAGLLSMTVVGPTLAEADAYSTAAFVMGLDGAAWVAGLDGFEACAITLDRRTVWTPGFERLVVR